MLFYYSQNIVFTHNQMLFTFDFNLASGIFAEQYTVAFFYLKRYPLAVVTQFPVADRYYFTLGRFLLCGVRDNNSTLGLGFFLDPFYQNAIL